MTGDRSAPLLCLEIDLLARLSCCSDALFSDANFCERIPMASRSLYVPKTMKKMKATAREPAIKARIVTHQGLYKGLRTSLKKLYGHDHMFA